MKPAIRFGGREKRSQLSGYDDEVPEPSHACEGFGATSVFTELGRRARRGDVGMATAFAVDFTDPDAEQVESIERFQSEIEREQRRRRRLRV